MPTNGADPEPKSVDSANNHTTHQLPLNIREDLKVLWVYGNAVAIFQVLSQRQLIAKSLYILEIRTELESVSPS